MFRRLAPTPVIGSGITARVYRLGDHVAKTPRRHVLKEAEDHVYYFDYGHGTEEHYILEKEHELLTNLKAAGVRVPTSHGTRNIQLSTPTTLYGRLARARPALIMDYVDGYQGRTVWPQGALKALQAVQNALEDVCMKGYQPRDLKGSDIRLASDNTVTFLDVGQWRAATNPTPPAFNTIHLYDDNQDLAHEALTYLKKHQPNNPIVQAELRKRGSA